MMSLAEIGRKAKLVNPPDEKSRQLGLRAQATVIWSMQDHVMMPQICLDGIHRHLAAQSEVIVLPRS